MEKTKFVSISRNEVKFSYKNKKFILKEKRFGVYGLGYCVSLYELNGVNKSFVKSIGLTKSDNYGTHSKGFLLPNIVSFEDCKLPALKYVKLLLA